MDGRNYGRATEMGLIGVAEGHRELGEQRRMRRAELDGCFVEAIAPDDGLRRNAGLDRTIELPVRGRMKPFRGDRFLTELALPNFFFHLTIAYAILRSEGVPLEKVDFMGQ